MLCFWFKFIIFLLNFACLILLLYYFLSFSNLIYHLFCFLYFFITSFFISIISTGSISVTLTFANLAFVNLISFSFIYQFVRSIWDVWGRHSAEGEPFSSIQPSFHSGIRFVPTNVVMVALGMYGKSPLWKWKYGIMWAHTILTVSLFLILRSLVFCR